MRDLVPNLIEIGVDILNPVQVSAARMDRTELKRELVRELVFWAGGGFVFAAVHNIGPNVPVANILAMRAALREANGG